GQADVVADASANASFHDQWHASKTVVEPTIYDDWVSIAGLPVKITITVPIEAGIDASAQLVVDTDQHVEGHGSFNVICTSSSCDGSKNATISFQNNKEASLTDFNAHAHVDPWAQASVKLALYEGVATGQLGLRATLDADFWAYAGNACGDGNHDGTNEYVG